MGKKEGRNSRQQETYNVIHKRLIRELARGIEKPLKRARSELARNVGADRRTINKHLKEIPPDAMVLDKETGLWQLQYDRSVIIKDGRGIAFRNMPEGEEIGKVICESDQTDPQRIRSIFSPLETLFFDIDPFFLRHIFRYAIREESDLLKTCNMDTDITAISDEELENLWHDLFGDSKQVLIAFLINPQKLLEWVKGEGRDDLMRALPKEVWTQLCREASELRKQREEWDKKLKSLKKIE